jgi:hypothetical protein
MKLCTAHEKASLTRGFFRCDSLAIFLLSALLTATLLATALLTALAGLLLLLAGLLAAALLLLAALLFLVRIALVLIGHRTLHGVAPEQTITCARASMFREPGTGLTLCESSGGDLTQDRRQTCLYSRS